VRRPPGRLYDDALAIDLAGVAARLDEPDDLAVSLTRPGSFFESLVVSYTEAGYGNVYAVATELEASGKYSASVVGIDGFSEPLYSTTIVEP
jgi:hypothetical protein